MLTRLPEYLNLNPVDEKAFKEVFEAYRDRCHREVSYFCKLHKIYNRVYFYSYLKKCGIETMNNQTITNFLEGEFMPRNYHEAVDCFLENYLFEYISKDITFDFCIRYVRNALWIMNALKKMIDEMPKIEVEDAKKYLFFDALLEGTKNRGNSIYIQLGYLRKMESGEYTGDKEKDNKYFEVFKFISS